MSESRSHRRRVPAFTPVPLRYRRDGWTPGRQADFLGHLVETWNVAAAARHVGKSRESAYRLRDRPGAESFAAAWDAILALRAATRHAPDNDAVLKLYGREMRRRRTLRDMKGKSR